MYQSMSLGMFVQCLVDYEREKRVTRKVMWHVRSVCLNGSHVRLMEDVTWSKHDTG